MSAVFVLGWVIAVALLLVGIYALIAPHSLGRAYGVHVNEHAGAGFVRATGIRDVALGIAIGAAAYVHSLTFMAVLAVAGVAVSIGDLMIAYHHGPEKRLHPSHGIHAGGIVAFVLVLAMALFALGK